MNALRLWEVEWKRKKRKFFPFFLSLLGVGVSRHFVGRDWVNLFFKKKEKSSSTVSNPRVAPWGQTENIRGEDDTHADPIANERHEIVN
jgi:hypothetical protein